MPKINDVDSKNEVKSIKIAAKKQVATKPEFSEVAVHIKKLIDARRNSWELEYVNWEDVAQIIWIRAFSKYHLFDPKKAPLDHWANTLISNSLKNLLRDHLYKFVRPCIQKPKCVFNTGGDGCSWGGNSTGVQCSACPLYKKWMDKKFELFSISTPLNLDYHVGETSTVHEEYVNIEEKKVIIDRKVNERLDNDNERLMYKLLYIDKMSYEQVSVYMKYESNESIATSSYSKIPGYQIISRIDRKIKKLAKEIILNEDLLD
jgi:DNA-directed RNA polymerase specialized sigma24 family protein